ncbi:MAG: aldehyde ferredoxin oxidoreductase family protein [Hadesarchaea archaeon]|nr:aldehyde ferredoxin oxidoreductase family protein [Hadesarchaea archaeon]
MAEKYPIGGYAGRVLQVDLARGKTTTQELDKELAVNYIGGNGFCARLMFDMIKPGTAPLGPKNVLIFAAGPLNGTIWPQAGRYEVGAKSPLTGIYGEANSGGHWGAELKHAGFDAIIVRGRSPKPVYLFIEDGKTELGDAKQLWGRSTQETETALKEKHGQDSQVASIGQAGENLVRFAAIMTSYRAAARTGLGAVMGSKRLKAVAVRGGLDIEVANLERLERLADAARRRLLLHKFSASTTKYGTTILVELMSEIGRFPTRNFQSGVFEGAARIGGERLVREYKLKDRACFGCPLRCENFVRVPGAERLSEGKIEYETLSSLGGRCGNADLEGLIHANRLCNLYGIDTISCGGVIAFAMECYERGLLTKRETDGIELEWGNADAIITCIEKIARREGFGAKLAEGTVRFARKFGKRAERFTMVVKGMDEPAQDGRAQKSMGLSHATANRGADHLTSFEVLSEVGFVEEIEKRFGKRVMPEAADRLNPKHKALMVRDGENFCAVVDSLVACKFGAVWPPAFYFADYATVLTAVTGVRYTERDLREIGERIFTLERAFDIREGITAKDDRLPDRLTKDPAPAGPCKGHVVELDYMLGQYYKLRGWDRKTGWIPRSRLKALGLEDVAKQLAKLKKLPK